ncbi:hypothetical protein, partial [Jannaschia faecimaris]
MSTSLDVLRFETPASAQSGPWCSMLEGSDPALSGLSPNSPAPYCSIRFRSNGADCSNPICAMSGPGLHTWKLIPIIDGDTFNPVQHRARALEDFWLKPLGLQFEKLHPFYRVGVHIAVEGHGLDLQHAVVGGGLNRASNCISQVVRRVHFWRDLQSAFAIVTSFLATAVMTTLWGFPAARRRS